MESSSIADRSMRARRRFRLDATFLRAFLEDLPFLVITVAYAATALVLSRTIGVPDEYTLSFSWKIVSASTALFGGTLFLGLLVHEVMGLKNSLYAPSTWKNVTLRAFPPYKTLNYAFIFLVLPLFAKSFTSFKVSIASVHPFGGLDVLFMEWDRFVHFGQHPWVLLHPVLGHHWVTWVLDGVYYLWFPVLWITLIWQAWHGSRETPVRSQFVLAFLLCWVVLGNVMAMALSSAGPVYFEHVTGLEGPYDGLMAYLESVDAEHFSVGALWAQEVLWNAYEADTLREIGGISAMPSLHVATSVLLAIFGFKIDRRLGWAYATFAFLMFLGSIHLGWHYAIDGYVGAAGAAALWWLSGRIVRWWRRRAGVERDPVPSPS